MSQNASTKCPLCSYEAISAYSVTDDISQFSCGNCGKFKTQENNLAGLSEVDRAKLSHAVRKGQRDKGAFEITSDFISEVSKRELPTVVEQVDNLVVYFGGNSLPGGLLPFTSKACQALLGSVNESGFDYILNSSINDFKYLVRSLVSSYQGDNVFPVDLKFSLSHLGWKRYEELKRGTIQSHKAFMAMKFGDENLDRIFNDYFVPAVRDTGFTLERVDTNPKAGLIDDKIRVDIRSSRFIIADLTGKNQGVYWEAGYAEGLGKPVIYTCEKTQFNDIHFNASHLRTIIWEAGNPKDAAERLKATIRATLPGEAKMTDL